MYALESVEICEKARTINKVCHNKLRKRKKIKCKQKENTEM